MSKEFRPCLYYVRWVDACGDVGEWASFTDIENQGLQIVDSVGWCLGEFADHIILAAHICFDAEVAVGVMHIPKQAVVEKKQINTTGGRP